MRSPSGAARAAQRSRRGVVVVAVLALLLWGGCGRCGDGRSDSEALVPPPVADCRPLKIEPPATTEGARRSALFVITKLRFGSASQGLNLDCIATPSECSDDNCRDGPDDGEGGVDNRLGDVAGRLSDMAGSDLQGEMTQAIERGDHPLLLRVAGATSFEDGGAEALELSFGLPAGGVEGGSFSELTSGRGRVTRDPDSPAPRASRFEPVAIVDGLVTGGPTADWMPLFWTRGETAPVPVSKAYLKFRIATPPDEQGHGGRLVDGLLAGAIEPGDLSAAVLEMDARTAKVLGRLGPIVRALVRGQCDLDLIPGGMTERACSSGDGCLSGQRCRGSRCVEPAGRFDALSFGIEFEAVSVTED